jgi:phosphatidylinositol kinase/protein kinase (PI-3  family)
MYIYIYIYIHTYTLIVITSYIFSFEYDIHMQYAYIHLGSDGKQYMFLVKGGEDLRNDERIELLFDLMNLVVSTSTSSTTLNEENLKISKNNLRARTYSVIPMTSKMGIMEWVNNTQTLKAVVSGVYVYLNEYL